MLLITHKNNHKKICYSNIMKMKVLFLESTKKNLHRNNYFKKIKTKHIQRLIIDFLFMQKFFRVLVIFMCLSRNK